MVTLPTPAVKRMLRKRLISSIGLVVCLSHITNTPPAAQEPRMVPSTIGAMGKRKRC